MLKVKNLSFHYNKGKEILSDVSFELNKNDVLCLLGSNGTGKTTLLRCLLALNKSYKGIIEINGKDITNDLLRKEQNIWPMYHKHPLWLFRIYPRK